MEPLRQYLNSLTRPEQEAFCTRCGTTLGYLRKAISMGQRLNGGLAVAIERETGGVVPVEVTRPDIDWSVVRQSDPKRAA